MKRKRFSVEQITGILKQAELGAPIAELCRQHGISEQSYYRWKKIYGGMEPSEARELKDLREENIKLKRLVADLSLDKVMLQDVLQKMYDPPRVCKYLLRREWLVGLPKCIRPTDGTSSFLALMVMRARLAS